MSTVDSNMLRDDGLMEYLSYSDRNWALLTDNVFKEAHQGAPTVTMSSSFKIVAQSGQFLIAPYLSSDEKRNLIIKPQNWYDLIDWKRTQQWRQLLPKVLENTDKLRNAIEEFGFKENKIRKEKEAWLKFVISGFNDMQKNFSNSELAALKDDKKMLEPNLSAKFLALSHALYEKNPYRDGIILEIEDRLYTPVYRFILGWTMLFLLYTQNNINYQYSSSRIYNDLNDAYIAAQATYTHSMLTKDKGATFLYLRIAEALKWQGVELPEDDFVTLE